MLDLLYPRKCVICGEVLDDGEEHLCRACLADMPLTFYWNWPGNPAERILWGRTYLQSVTSLFFYRRESAYKELLHDIKYHGARRLGRYLGRLLGEKMLSGLQFLPIDILVPVPLHWRKKFRRGYNQSEVIARGISDALGDIPIESRLLRRTHFTRTQTHITVGSKWINVSGAFSLDSKRSAAAAGKHILLVDDVLTTGATTEACYEELSKIPDVHISLATLAFVSDF